MNLIDLVFYAIRSLQTTKLRTYLTVIGIIIGVISLVVITSISEGVQKEINNQLAAFGTDKMFVMPAVSGGARSFGGGSPIQSATTGKLFQRDVDSIASIPGVKSVSSGVYGRSTIGFRGREVTATIYGMSSEFFSQWDNYLEIESGRFYQDNERRVVVLAYDAAKNTFGKDELGVGNIMTINGKDYRVVGILKRIGTSLSAADDSSIYIPYDDGREELASQLSKNEVQYVSIQLLDGYSSADVQDAIERKLAANHKVKVEDKDFMVISSDYINETIGAMLGALSLFLLFITLIASVVGGIGIMNTMLMGVLERVREIGVLKAVGATELDIMLIFVTESGMLGFIGGLVGFLLSVLLLSIIGIFGVPYWLRLRVILFAFIFSAVIGIVAGLIPARQAAKLDPVDALRYE